MAFPRSSLSPEDGGTDALRRKINLTVAVSPELIDYII
jgi:hypothetical protein